MSDQSTPVGLADNMPSSAMETSQVEPPPQDDPPLKDDAPPQDDAAPQDVTPPLSQEPAQDQQLTLENQTHKECFKNSYQEFMNERGMPVPPKKTHLVSQVTTQNDKTDRDEDAPAADHLRDDAVPSRPKRKRKRSDNSQHNHLSDDQGSDDTLKMETRKKKLNLNDVPTKFRPVEHVPKTENAAAPAVKPSPQTPLPDLPHVWAVGDLVWARVAGHPWWPCIVSLDPCGNEYSRVQRMGRSAGRVYYVQFFGEVPEHAWVSGGNIHKFENGDQFETLPIFQKPENMGRRKKKSANAHGQKKPTLVKAPKSHKSFKNEVKPSRKPAWQKAVSDAEATIPLSLQERNNKQIFKYSIPTHARKPSKMLVALPKPKLKPAAKASEPTPKDPELNSDVAAAPREDDETPDEKPTETDEQNHSMVGTATAGSLTPPKKRPYPGPTEKTEQQPSGRKPRSPRVDERSTIRFSVFCQKTRENVRTEYPDRSDEQIEELLYQQWHVMTEKQRARYRSRFSMSPRKLKDPYITATSSIIEKKQTKKALQMAVSKAKKQRGKNGNSSSQELDEDSAMIPQNEESSAIDGDLLESLTTLETLAEAGAQANKMKNLKQKTKTKTQQPPPRPAAGPPKKRGRPAKPKIELPPIEIPLPTVNNQTPSPSQDESSNPPDILITVTPDPESSNNSSDCDQLILANDAGSAAGGGKTVVASRKENICQICERPGELLLCEGGCCGAFHIECIALTQTPTGPFKCEECTTGIHSCFICKSADESVKRCSVSLCGKYYHERCLKLFPLARIEPKGFTCCLHACLACSAENPKNNRATKGRLTRCVRCPTAYHSCDGCIAAGSIVIASNAIVCARHFQPVKTQKHHTHVNVSWCFVCSKGGDLLCCETCPAAFHIECIGLDKIPDGNFYCTDCSTGKRPQYGDIVWVKLGNYRWWPAEVCNPKVVPSNIMDLPHQVGEFPVRFFGSHDYFWLHQGRVFLFHEGDKGSKEVANAKGLAAVFRLALKEATERFKEWKQAKDQVAAARQERSERKPPAYKYTRTNKALGNVQIYTADPSECTPCDCNALDPNPCGPASECINRMLLVECHPKVCPAKEKCQNQKFQKGEYPDFEIYKTKVRGWGIRSRADVKKGQFINEYAGDLIDIDTLHQRLEKSHENSVSNFYFMTLDNNRIIDAGPRGNFSRFMNHCCAPNCETQKWTVNGDTRVGLFALQDIATGTELTFNYKFDCVGNEKTPCGCGALNCSGFIGVAPKNLIETKDEKQKRNNNKAKRKKIDKRLHDNECFECGGSGELVMCDKKGCPKAYHLTCLNLAKPPYGRWECPWHFCDSCGKPAVNHCYRCTDSFCTAHTSGSLFETESGTFLCKDHHKNGSGPTSEKTIEESSPVVGATVSGPADTAPVPVFTGPVKTDPVESSNSPVPTPAAAATTTTTTTTTKQTKTPVINKEALAKDVLKVEFDSDLEEEGDLVIDIPDIP